MSEKQLSEPWLSFLNELDALLNEPAELHCLGGFVIADRYDFSRTTADVDVLQINGKTSAALARLAGRGSALHTKHKVYVDIVAVASVPECYQDRLTELHSGAFRNLRLLALEPHDLVLAKLERNIDRDREDVKRLASKPGLDRAVLECRYHDELRHQLSRPEREDTTLEMWLDLIEEVQVGRPA